MQVMRSITLSILFLLVYGVSEKTMAHCNSSISSAAVQVGVILDMGTWIGKMSWRCISIGVDDFYAMHPNYSTRLKLHLRHSGGDVVSSASAALDLLNNAEVEAIIGPQSSEQAKFVAELGNKFKVPVFSFSATSPMLSSNRFPYLVRTVFNDSIQAKVIVDLVQSFGWREVSVILEDSDYGYGILPYLLENFQKFGTNILNTRIISDSMTDKQIQEALYSLKNIRPRIFVVHASQELSHRITLMAKEEKLTSEGSAWFMTCGLADYLSLMNSSSVDAMQGILSISQYVPESKRLNDFMVRWHEKYFKNNQKFKIAQPGSFGLLAYDTTWALAVAAETSCQSRYGHQTSMTKPKTLLSRMSNTEFHGISGKFSIVDSQLNVTAFEVVKVVGNRVKKIGFWSSDNGFSLSMKPNGTGAGILWPGHSVLVSKILDLKTRNSKKLRIAIPRTRFTELVNYEWNSYTQRKGGGFCIKVFDMVMASLGDAAPSYEYILYNQSSYDELVYQVSLQKFDAAVGDITINANRSLYVDFTVPFSDLGVSMLVPEHQWKKSIWIFLKPLKAGLWLACAAFFVFTGIVVWALEHRINEEEFGGSPINQIGTVLFFSFSTLVFAHKEKLKSNLARIVVVIWVFVVLILQSSYTASLTSLLTVQELHPAFTNLNDLIKNGAYIGFQSSSAVFNKIQVDRSKLRGYVSVEQYHDALQEGSSRGGVSAIVDETPYLKIFLSKYSSKYTMVGPIYQSGGLGFAFPKGSSSVPNISKVILKSTDEIEKLYRNMTADSEREASSSPSLELDSFWGLFLITGVTSSSALIVYLFLTFNQHRRVLSSGDRERSLRGRLATIVKLIDQKSRSAHPVTNSELRDENRRGSPGNEELEMASNISSHVCEISSQESVDQTGK